MLEPDYAFIRRSQMTVIELRKLVRTLYQDDNFFSTAKSMYPKLADRKAPDKLLYFDVAKCYVKLEHGMNLFEKESQLIFLLFFPVKGLGCEEMFNDLEGTLKSQELVYNELRREILEQVRGMLMGEDFLVASILKKTGDQESLQRFYIALYRASSIIAKADGKIYHHEGEWLASLIKAGQECGTVFHPSYIRESSLNYRPALSEKPEPTKSMRELDGLIGLDNVKEQVRTLANFTIVQQRRAQKGLKNTPLSLHCVFTGNPGTGKTTVARIMGKMFREIGLLGKGQLIEVDRSALVANYIGQTAEKTNKVIDSALGGVLFIDEAYSLVNDSKEDYGHEAISTLIKRMEDERDRLVIILAGYTENMEEFLASNPGLRSRFARVINFEDYTADQLFEIYSLQLKKFDYRITEPAAAELKQIINKAVESKGNDFGNGRYARTLFERSIEMQANRVAFLPDCDENILNTIEVEDIKKLTE